MRSLFRLLLALALTANEAGQANLCKRLLAQRGY